MKKNYTERDLFLKRQKRDKIKIVSLQISVLAVFVILWEALTYWGILDSFFVSSPSRIIKQLLKTDALWTHIKITLLECIYGFLISAGTGLVAAIILWCSDTLRRVLEPYIVVLNSLPKIALGPLIIIWVGIGTKAIVVMTFLICIIVAIIGFLNGFLSCDEDKILLLKSMGANKLQILFKLILPGSLINIISVLKVNVGLAWVGTIMGEYLVSGAGLGYLIIFGGQIFQQSQGLLIVLDYVFCRQSPCLIETYCSIYLEEEYIRPCVLTIYLNHLIETVIQSLRVILYIVDHVKAHVVHGSDGIFRIVLGTCPVDGNKRVHKCILIDGILAVLADKVSHEGGTVYEHCLIGCRRTETICLSPVRESVIVVFLLIIFVVIGQILDTFSTVSTVLPLCGSHARPCQHEYDREKQKNIFFHIAISLFHNTLHDKTDTPTCNNDSINQ